MATKPEDILGMSDDDFNNQIPPEVDESDKQAEIEAANEAAAKEIEAAQQEESKTDEQKDEGQGSGDDDQKGDDDSSSGSEEEKSEADESDKDEGSDEKDEDESGKDDSEKSDDEQKSDDKSGAKEAEADKSKEADAAKEGEAKPDLEKKADDKKDTAPETEAVNYEDAYKTIMAPFKANGRKIELKSPEEAVKLMQMGANYAKKMQDLQPHRKLLLMLQNNNLLDPGKLEYLIDLDKKNPEAIKKLVKDSGLDPLEIDTTTEPAYLKGDHSVSDNELAFTSVLDELSSDPAGKETLVDINTRMDQTSKDMLWENPEIMTILHQQRETGVYTKITDEMERLKMLGDISPTTPFLEAYKTVGDMLFSEAKPSGEKQVEAKEPPKVIATTVAKPKEAAKNGDKVSAASPTRSTPRKASVAVNPLALPDDEFMKQFEGRL